MMSDPLLQDAIVSLVLLVLLTEKAIFERQARLNTFFGIFSLGEPVNSPSRRQADTVARPELYKSDSDHSAK